MIARCERCKQECEVKVKRWQERHGFSFGPYEQWSEEGSVCCGAEVEYLPEECDVPWADLEPSTVQLLRFVDEYEAASMHETRKST